MPSPRVIVIGAGIGGLECACILGRLGYDVTVLEQNQVPGGCLQPFHRKGIAYETGFHYVGGLGEGEVLHPVFKYLNLLDLPWRQMDVGCVDEIHLGQRCYSLPSGYDRFVDVLSRDFPHCRSALREYVNTLENIGRMALGNFGGGESLPYFGMSAYDFICRTIPDETLRQVLGGASLRLHQDAETLPLYVFAQIANSFIQSGWRLEGGGAALVNGLRAEVERRGGRVLTGRRVVSIEALDRCAAAALTEDGERFEADIFISDAHPSATLALLDENAGVRRSYRSRIDSLRQSFGVFTLNLNLDGSAVPYVNHNIYIHDEGTDVWNYDFGRGGSFLVSFASPASGADGRNVDVMTPMRWSDVELWKGTLPMRRGGDYEKYKAGMAGKCFDALCRVFPSAKESVRDSYTSTALTWHDYTGGAGGAAFGVMKDWHNPLTTVLSPSTPVNNLYMTGQNLNLHGILGVSMTALYTCAAITDTDTVKKELGI